MAMKNPTKTYRLALIGVMTAILCILGPLSIPLPFSPVPLSLTNFAILLAVFLLGWKWGTVSCGIYLLLGLVGVPVFSGFRAEWQNCLAQPGAIWSAFYCWL